MWLFDTSLALGCLIAISVWKDSGYCMLVLLAGMQAIDTALYDAARVDGANAFGQMRHVTLPGTEAGAIVCFGEQLHRRLQNL